MLYSSSFILSTVRISWAWVGLILLCVHLHRHVFIPNGVSILGHLGVHLLWAVPSGLEPTIIGGLVCNGTDGALVNSTQSLLTNNMCNSVQKTTLKSL